VIECVGSSVLVDLGSIIDTPTIFRHLPPPPRSTPPPSPHLQDLQRLLDAVDDTGAELWSIAEQTRDSVEALITAFETDGWAEEQAKTLVRCANQGSPLYPRCCPRVGVRAVSCCVIQFLKAR
jgi:hypothetical protein